MTNAEFWKWFAKEEPRLRRLAPEEAVPIIEESLQRVDPRLGVELGTNTEEVQEMMVTAGGEKDAFSIVRSLTEIAPAFPAWLVVPLKPPRGFRFSLDAGGREVKASLLVFDPLESSADADALGILVYVDPDLAKSADAQDIVWLILETGVGEYAAAQIAHLEVASREEATGRELPIEKLGEYIEWHARRGRR